MNSDQWVSGWKKIEVDTARSEWDKFAGLPQKQAVPDLT